MKSLCLIKLWIIISLCCVGLVACAAEQKTTSSRDPVVFFMRDDDLWRTDLNGNKVEQLTAERALDWHPEPGTDWVIEARYRRPQVSPDGQWIVLSQRNLALVLVNVAEHTQVELSEPGALNVAWSPDSRYLAYTPQSRTDSVDLVLYDIQRGQANRLFSVARTTGVGIHDIVWSPDGRFIAFACCFVAPPSGVYTGTLVGEIRTIEISTRQVQNDGRAETSVAGGSGQLCWTTDGQVTTNPAKGVRCSYTPPVPYAFSPDGEQLAVLAPLSSDETWETGSSRLTVSQATTGEILWQREISVAAVQAVAWSPDGQYLLLDDTEIHSPIWRLKTDGTSDLERIVEDGFFLDIVRQWQRKQ
jgi:Tol biopolymer transport system component